MSADRDERDPYGEAEQWGMQYALSLFGKHIAGIENWEVGDGSESVDGDVLAEFHNIAKAAGWVNVDGDTVFGLNPAADREAVARDALEFYADPRRYYGPNQRPIAEDKFAQPNDAYLRDVTRDGGEIARKALSGLPSAT